MLRNLSEFFEQEDNARVQRDRSEISPGRDGCDVTIEKRLKEILPIYFKLEIDIWNYLSSFKQGN